eukprot:scaffold57714_cov66-Phaeocystis_antarctica.AAC.5
MAAAAIFEPRARGSAKEPFLLCGWRCPMHVSRACCPVLVRSTRPGFRSFLRPPLPRESS